MMKRRRIEITVSRRRTTIHLRNNLAAATAERTVHQAEALPTLATTLASVEAGELNLSQATSLTPPSLTLNEWGSENHLADVEPEAE
jgi:hypothetical protein